MKVYALAFLVLVVVLVECKHTFMGTNVYRDLVFHRDARFESKSFRKRIEYLNFTMPHNYYGRRIQGILAYDTKNSGASCNVTEGGVGFDHVKLRLKSDRNEPMRFDIYIYV